MSRAEIDSTPYINLELVWMMGRLEVFHYQATVTVVFYYSDKTHRWTPSLYGGKKPLSLSFTTTFTVIALWSWQAVQFCLLDAQGINIIVHFYNSQNPYVILFCIQ